MSVLIETSEGDIVIDLLTEERPRACLNFLKLCKMKMYNYCLFHDIQQNFIIQTGAFFELKHENKTMFNLVISYFYTEH